MNIDNCTDDELAWAVVRYLAQGPTSQLPLAMYVNEKTGAATQPGTWFSGRCETYEAFQARFPRQMDKLKVRKAKRSS